MSQTGYPLINGREFSFASVTLQMFGLTFYPTAIDYEDGLTPGRVKKSGSAIPAGSTRGEWDGSASVEFTVGDSAELIAAAQVAGLGSWGLAVGSATVLYQESIDVNMDTLPAFRMMKAANSPGSGSDPSKVKFDLFLMKPILRGNSQAPVIADAPVILG